MTEVSMADCVGLWRRVLLVEADGTRDTSTNIVWLQGISFYVDSRGFAGTLAQHADVFEWSRAIDVLPPEPTPDAGSMRWEGSTLIETGVHADYVEHWVRDPGGTSPCWAVALSDGESSAQLMRVGQLFGWADDAGVVVGDVEGPEWSSLAVEFEDQQFRANGIVWNVTDTEGNVEL
jgi:hypothetical protein